jgi:hypothetical protein
LISCEVRKPETGHEGEGGHVVGLLNGSAGENGETGRPGGIDVGVVTEDRERVPGDGARRDMEHARLQLAGDLEHVRQHEEQALARGECRRKGATLQGAMDNAGGTSLRLHLDDLGHLPPQVPAAGGRPGVGQLPHRARGRDRIDGDHLSEPVRDARRRLVAVHDQSVQLARFHTQKLGPGVFVAVGRDADRVGENY